MRQGTRIIVLIVLMLGPFVLGAGPATRPAPSTRVLVLPLESINPTANDLWIGPAVQQSLLADFATVKALEPVTLDAQPSNRPNGFVGVSKAIDLGREQNADFVLFGSFQTLDGTVRITAQVLHVDRGEIVGGLKATGPIDDLFDLQDQLADQARRVMVQRNASRPNSNDESVPPEPRLELAVTGPLTIHDDNPYYDRAIDRTPEWLRNDGRYLAGNYYDGQNDYYYGLPPEAYVYRPYFRRYYHPYYPRHAFPYWQPYAPRPFPYFVP